MLLNLLSNAIKYNHYGGTVTVIARDAGRRVRVEVIDSGIGIESDQAGQLFQPFTRLAAGAARAEGTGLGLSLSRALIEAMDGEIAYGPRADQHCGACFWVELPLAKTAALPGPGTHSYAPTAFAEQRAITILLVEDHLANAQLIEAVVARHLPQARLVSAMQARLGLDLAMRHRPDLVLLDLHLPDKDGDWVLAELQASLPDLPVILLTADAIAAQDDWAARGASSVLTKPIDVPALMAAMNRTLLERTA